MGEEPESTLSPYGESSASRSDRDLDPGRGGPGKIHGEGGEEGREGVCDIAVQRVLELRVAAQGEDVRAETEIDRPRQSPGGRARASSGSRSIVASG